MLTMQPASTNCRKSSGMAVISFDFSSVASPSQYQAVLYSPGTHQVERLLACCVIVRASACLAIARDHSFKTARDPLRPLYKTRFKLLRIDVGKHSSKGVMRGDPVGQLQQLGEPVLLRFAKFFDAYPSIRSTDHATHRDENDLPQSMQLP